MPFALLAARTGHISAGGAVAGLACGALTYAAFYFAGFAVLGAALILTIGATRVSASRRTAEHLVDGDDRGAANIIANCGVGAGAALVETANVLLRGDVTALWFVTAISAGASDSVASEVGKAFGGRPRSFPSFRRVAPGTPGAVSLAGSLAGALASGIIGVPAAALWLIDWHSLALVVLACTVGSFVESALATAFDRGGRAANHLLNLTNTAVSATLALVLQEYSRP